MRRILLGCLVACFFEKWVCLCRKINDLISLGHVNVCTIDMRISDAQECVLENKFGKAFLFVCYSGEYLDMRSEIIPASCAHRTFINLSDPTEFSADNDTYELFQNLIGTNNSNLNGNFLFFGTPYSNKDIDLSCLCYGEGKEKVKHVMKLVFKKTKKKIKGCDFGYNILSRRDLTNNIELNRNAPCVIHAYPGDVIGINCYKKERNHSYNEKLELVPNNCFHSVQYGNDIILSTNNLIPNSRVIPDSTTDVNLSPMHSYMSYMILPKDMTMTGKISCQCKRGGFVGSMFIYLKTANNLLYDSNGIDRIIEKENVQENSDEGWRGRIRKEAESNQGKRESEIKTDVKENNEREQDIHNHYNNINSIYYNSGIIHPSRRYDYREQSQSGHRNEGKESSVDEPISESNTYSYSNDKNFSRESFGNKVPNENNYDAYYMGIGEGFSRGPQRRKKRTFWENLFGLSSSSQFSSFNAFILSFLGFIYAGYSPL
ncbi:6-cysteine protein [Plasmodium knowlesi strain H]|uniref:6-cysteine protein n=3 Tax=Plasmodium knowlesi TaxID=5850 RepID=A0A5K1UWU3_PLAKH|nr:Pf52-like protein [Plasmodium knowlesi strain H]OTN68539.1 6-cysteine protein [Plasmodium knowlesi]CAA9986453.1 6-cysteine protein P52, putative [Plasmodium knowlesi strain H]SBO24297.1 6-cysteine protein [Plasmodium knowlesi strain H]SBO29701.1 6-cysteine protein [Plasmodium knowlesi strain H]VVS75927.1 6-cysteine protein P52, putative [Plasmodium knowlesi strain H]|eukprot:XP_002261004.1 Pf52-like protein [Plasmodium knowlesi strain H]